MGTRQPAASAIPRSCGMALAALDSVIEEARAVGDLAARLKLTEGIVELLADSRPRRCRDPLDALFDDLLRAKATQGGTGQSPEV